MSRQPRGRHNGQNQLPLTILRYTMRGLDIGGGLCLHCLTCMIHGRNPCLHNLARISFSFAAIKSLSSEPWPIRQLTASPQF